MEQFDNSSYLGFTLIEILVTMAIILLMAGLSFAGYASLTERQKLISAGQTFKNIVRDAQSRAYNGEIDCNIGACDCLVSNLTGWYVDLTNKQIYGFCDSTSFSIKDFNLPEDIAITPYLTPNPTPPVKLLFKTLPPSISQTAVVCLSNNKLADSFYRVSINNAGVISDDGGLITTCP